VDTEESDLFHTACNLCVHAAMLLQLQAAEKAWPLLDAAADLLQERARYLASAVLRGRGRQELQ
jgi:hypothetical protein